MVTTVTRRYAQTRAVPAVHTAPSRHAPPTAKFPVPRASFAHTPFPHAADAHADPIPRDAVAYRRSYVDEAS